MSRHLLPATLAANDEVSSRLQALADVYSALKPSDDDWKASGEEATEAGKARMKVLGSLNNLLGD